MSSYIRTFGHTCIHFLSVVGGGKVPRLLGPAVYGTKPNDVLQFDYIALGPSRTGEKNFLILGDDYFDYNRFYCIRG